MSEARILVVGAGAMSGLSVATVGRHGCRELVIANRTQERAQRLAGSSGGRAVPLTDLDGELAAADVVISCTGAVGHVLRADQVAAAMAARDDRPQAYLDLALPRDVDPAVGDLVGVCLVALDDLGRMLVGETDGRSAVAEAKDLVTAEVASYLTRRRALDVAPTVAALRARARQVLQAEMERLDTRLPGLEDHDRAEVRLAMHRVVEKLLHTPTVRVKELAGACDPGDYAQALRDLFELDPYDVAAVSTPPARGGEGGLV